MSDNSQLALLDGALSLEKMTQFRALIEKTMASVMKENLHYGKVQGCGDKPTLLQPGAQLLCTLFRMRPEYDITESDPASGHKRFRITCRLYLMGDPPCIVGEGVGEASSMESKHRFRNAAAIIEDTGENVPPNFWTIKNERGLEEAKKWLATAFDGAPVSVKKFGDEGWRVIKVIGGGDEKIENPNPADVFNTVLKMAKKRAFVDATITATSSNDFFTADLEDIRDNIEAVNIKTAQERGGKALPAEPKEKPAAESHSGHWKTSVCHIGKKGGPIQGKPLGALEDGQRAWLLRTISEKDESRRSAADKKLYAALLLWQEERNSARDKPNGAPEGGKSPERRNTAAPATEGNGVNLEVLASNLDWGNIPTETFLKIAHEEGWTKAEEFGKITDAEATAMVEQIEVVTSRCQEAMSLAKGTGGIPA